MTVASRISCVGVILGLAISFPSHAAPPETFGGEAAVRAFLRSHFKANDLEDLDVRSTNVTSAFADLDGDGRLDALAYVSGAAWCGSGGCKLYVLENRGRSYRIVGRTTVTRPPIRVLQRRTHGWRDIGVWVAGGGIIPGHDVVLRFDGWKYPSNPSTQTALKHFRDRAGEVVIARDAPAVPL
jgi:hypothetical protein